MMDITSTLTKALRELQTERRSIENAIQKLQHLIKAAGGRGQRGPRVGAGKAKRGSRRASAAVGKKARSRKGWTAAKRKAAALRMKRYWAERRKAARRG